MCDKLKQIRSLPLFEGVTEDQLVAIEKVSQCRHLKNNEILFNENDPVQSIYVVIYGSFKILKQSEQDNQVIFNFLGRNEVLGSSVARLPMPRYTVSAVANEESCILKLSLPNFTLHFLKNPILETRVHAQISERFVEFQEDRCLSNSLVSQKLAHFLLRTLDRQHESCRQQILIPLTRIDIAKRIGSKTETIVRKLSQWTKNGWLKTHSKHIEILNREALEKVK